MNLATQLPFEESDTTLDLNAGNHAFKPFYMMLDQYAKQHPNRIALKFNETCWLYQNFLETVNKLAKLLKYNGVKKGDIIGLALDRSAEMVISLLAILKSGAAYLPLDPSYPKDRIEFMLSDAAARLLLTSKKYQGYFITEAPELLIEDAWATFDRFGPAEPATTVSADDIAYILYTSGSTGKPKGVLISHQNLANFLLSMLKKPGISADDRLLAISTISFDIAGLELFLPLICGAQIVLADTQTAKDGWLLLELMRNEKVTLMQATPYTWRMLIAAGWDEFLPIRIVTGGESLPKDLAEQLLWRCSEVWNQYGPTETTVYSTQKLITDAGEITIGLPIDNTTVYVLDESLHKQPDGSVGELFIGGDGVAKGYLNRPELTAKQFIDDPFSDRKNGKMYRTGDLGSVMPNGEIQCMGRMDHQVKVRGFRIELEEIEYVLLKAVGVREAVATVTTDSGDARIIAYIVPTNDHRPDVYITELTRILSGQLPAHMVPDDFILLSSIPVTSNGKVDRKALPKPEANGGKKTKPFLAPRTEMEKQLVKIWKDLMGMPQIGINDNFFALGGHSLVAVQMMARIQKIIGRRLPIATLLKYPTVADLAAHLCSDEDTSGLNSLVEIKRGGSKRPLYIIHGEGLNVLYFNDLAINLDNEQPVYGLQARGLKGDDPLEVMEEIAANYVEEILAQDPIGPYFLAGYSFGGYVAIEMRKQMKAKDKEVIVIIFDTDAEKSEYKSWAYLVPRKVKRNFPRVVSKISSALANPGSTFQAMQTRMATKLSTTKGSREFYRQIKKIKAKLRIALRNYDIEPFDDKVYLYKARVCTHYVDDTEFLGWTKFARKGVEICEVSGDHLSMLLQPNVVDFAQKLQRGIDSLPALKTNNGMQLTD